MQQSLLCLQKGGVWENVADLVDFTIYTLIRLEELLTTVYVKHEGHDILRNVLGDLGKLGTGVSSLHRNGV